MQLIPNRLISEKTNTHNWMIFNAILWVCSYIILLFLFAGRTTPEKIDYIYTSCFVISLIIPVSFNLYFLVPKFLKTEKNLLFFLFFVINLIVFCELNPLFFESIVAIFFNDYYFISYHNTVEIYFLFFIFFTLSLLIKIGEDWVYFNKRENLILKEQKQHIEQQLYYLKGQINPHFLFNSLNVLYSLAIDKKEEITAAILQLSDILRYVIYDVEADKIALQKEVDLIENYISFEKNRHIKGSKITFESKVNEQQQIYPMLLLPIIENSFKHGLKSGVENPFVSIKLFENKGIINLKVDNNFKAYNANEKENYNGIGLKNIKENLNLIYPNKHQFNTEINDGIFEVNLSINLNHED